MHNARPTAERLEPRAYLTAVPAGFSDGGYAGGFASPTAMEFLPDGRLLIAEQRGQLRMVKNGSLLATPVLTVTVNSSGERGLIGVTADPNFNTNKYVYVTYTATTPNLHNRVSRFTMTGDTAASELVLLELDPLSGATNHNGGALHFGPDGKLYVATGDNANSAHAQSLSTTHGKILRVNADGSIPTDNPFYTATTGLDRAIWAYGLRNPFTFAFQPGTGTWYVNDVGQNTYEEINAGARAANYGWPAAEGPAGADGYVRPVYSYDHSQGFCIVGGAFYDTSSATRFPSSYTGDYFFGDFVSGWIRSRDAATGAVTTFGTGAGGLVDFDLGADGALYYLTRNYAGGGPVVRRVAYVGTGAPVVTRQPESQTKRPGESVTFAVAATGAAPLSYQWQRNGVDIAAATAATYTRSNLTAADNNALFRCVVRNPAGTATSDAATLTVITNAAPTAVITSPANGTIFAGGQTFSFAGSGSDAEDGTLPASALTWEILLHHDTHTHPFYGPTTGISSGAFTIPRVGETSANIYYMIRLTARDSAGNTTTTTSRLNPSVQQLTLASTVPGLRLALDGQPQATPHTVSAVAGMTRQLSAPPVQELNDLTYQFVKWSDNGAASHSVNAPAAATTYTAVYRQVTAASGLSGVYFDNADLTGTSVTRRDTAINFNWGGGSPVSPIAADTFSARWTGHVRADRSELYTFHVTGDDGVRLWVNDQLVINQWAPHAATEFSGSIPLTAGQKVSLRLEYFEQTGQAVCALRWSSPSTPKALIPAANLSTTTALPAANYLSTDVGGVTPTGSTTQVTTGRAYDVSGGGADVGGAADRFRYAHRLVRGDFDLAVRVDSLSALDDAAKGGLMVRDGLAAGARNVFAGLTRLGQTFASYRTTTNGSTTRVTSTTQSPPNSWLRLRRVGDTFTTFRSTNGTAWTQVNQVTIDLPDVVNVGLAVTSGNATRLATFRFRDMN